MLRTLPLLASASLLAFAAPAFAQDARRRRRPPPAAGRAPQAADSRRRARTIVVTARKREERLQDVPVAVTAVTGDTIEKRGLTRSRKSPR